VTGSDGDGLADPRVLEAAEALWDFHCIYDSLTPADAIVGLGSYDLRVADRCAALFLDGYAPTLILTGATGNWTQQFPKSEAATFADRAMALGVPADSIRLEERARNIGENVRFSAELLGRDLRVIFVTKPQTQRRCLATVKKQWPEARAMITAPLHGFRDQPTEGFPLRHLIEEMVGDLWRIRTYPAAGFQIPQDVPPDVLAAYDLLVAAGFIGQLPAD